MISKVVSDPAFCREETCSVVKFEENSQVFYLDNKSRKTVLKIKTDCQHMASVEKCDYVAEVESCAFYIELKGSDVKKAWRQVLSTVPLFGERHNNWEKKCVVIYSRHPQIDTTLQNLEMKIRDSGMRLIKGKSGLRFSI